MDEQDIFMVELDGLFPEEEESQRARGTAGEILERIADIWGLEEEEDTELELDQDGVYPSARAIRAHHLLEDQIGKSGAFDIPDMLLAALVQEGLIRYLSDEESDGFADEDSIGEYEEARSGLDDEWTDGVWET